MDALPDATTRIFSAADALYEESKRESFPTVDAVRKRARVNMNDASTGMKAWRRAQIRAADTSSIAAPEKIQAASMPLLNALWSEAVKLASESLRAAQAVWAAERDELNIVADEMANAFELQATELQEATAENERHVSQFSIQGDALSVALNKTKSMSEEIQALQAKANLAEARVVELGLRVDDLHGELEHARRTVEGQRLSLETASANWRIDALRITEQAENERKNLMTSLLEAREANAKIRGRLEAMEEAAADRRPSAVESDSGASGIVPLFRADPAELP